MLRKSQYLFLGVFSLLLISAMLVSRHFFSQAVLAQGNTQTEPESPADILDFSHWKLTIPEDTERPGDPDEIYHEELEAGYSDAFFKLNSETRSVIFRAPANGDTTGGSNYPRSELREMWYVDGEYKKASWSSTDGLHGMKITQRVTELPKNKPHVVVGQIHDDGDDVVVFRVEGPKPEKQPGPIKLMVKTDEKDAEGNSLSVTIDPEYQLGETFTVAFIVANGLTRMYYNDTLVQTIQKDYSKAYFKAGAYTQASCTYAASGFTKEDCSDPENIPAATVEIEKLEVCHGQVCHGSTPPPTPATPPPTPSPAITPTPTPTPSPSFLPADINRDGQVDVFDLERLITAFDEQAVDESLAEDIVPNNRVDIFDYNLLLQQFGQLP